MGKVDGDGWSGFAATLGILVALTCGPAVAAGDVVVLLHGLGRTKSAMEGCAKAADSAGMWVLNLDYPSRDSTVERLSEGFLDSALKANRVDTAARLHFVTHSMGGILVRYYLGKHKLANLGRVVMLGPPNHGSNVASTLSKVPPVNAFMGPNLGKLRAGSKNWVDSLPVPPGEFAVIAGDRTVNWINSGLLLEGPDDGKVTVESARLEGTKVFRIVHVSHPFLGTDPGVARLAVEFLKSGTMSTE